MIHPDLLGPGDFVTVRAALVAEVGLVEAVVLARVAYRSTPEYRSAYLEDGAWWWRAPHDTIAEETGLSVKQVRRALDSLRADGHLVAEKHQREGTYDRALSYRVAFGPMHPPSGADVHAPSGADVPMRPVKTSPPTPPRGGRTVVESRKGYAKHSHEENAISALRRVAARSNLPLGHLELLGYAYEIGVGDPWLGYETMLPTFLKPIGDARDPGAVLRHRLGAIEPVYPEPAPPTCEHRRVEPSGYCADCGDRL